MAFNGSGTFNRLYNWVTDKANSIVITASRFDDEMDGMATGLSTCITKDGQTTLTANIPFNSKKITGLGNGSDRTDSIALGQVQDNTYEYLGENGGAADAYTWSPSPAITAYTAGQKWIVKIGTGDGNTGASTANISALGTRTIDKSDGAGSTTALESGDMIAGGIYELIDNGSTLTLQNPESQNVNVLVGSVIAFATETPPLGFLQCDGSTVSRTTYSSLFSVIGTTFGIGDGSTTFEIPDLRGEFIRGWDNGAGNDPDSGSRTDSGDGTTGDNVGTKQSYKTEDHKHATPFSAGGTGNIGYDSTGAFGTSATSFTRDKRDSNAGDTGTNAAWLTNDTLESTSGETRPRNVYMMYCIKY
jgi:microcystin-dependent protein